MTPKGQGWLCLSREEGDQIIIDERITIDINRISGRYVRICISAPKEVKIRRGELAPESPDA